MRANCAKYPVSRICAVWHTIARNVYFASVPFRYPNAAQCRITGAARDSWTHPALVEIAARARSRFAALRALGARGATSEPRRRRRPPPRARRGRSEARRNVARERSVLPRARRGRSEARRNVARERSVLDLVS